jgi:hypothetical protein
METWGGKRRGAGRPRDPNSLRAICEEFGVSTYKARASRRLEERAQRVLGDEKGAELCDQIERSELNLRQANRILDEANKRTKER